MKKIIKGSDVILNVTLRHKTSGDPYDLTGATEITACFEADDGTTVTFNMAVDSEISIRNAEPKLGKIAIAMTDTKTALLMIGDPVDFDITIDKGADREIIKVEQSLIIEDRNC